MVRLVIWDAILPIMTSLQCFVMICEKINHIIMAPHHISTFYTEMSSYIPLAALQSCHPDEWLAPTSRSHYA